MSCLTSPRLSHPIPQIRVVLMAEEQVPQYAISVGRSQQRKRKPVSYSAVLIN